MQKISCGMGNQSAAAVPESFRTTLLASAPSSDLILVPFVSLVLPF